MRTRIALPTLILAVLPALTPARPASAGPWGLSHGEWYSNVEGSTFTANTFHLAGGSRADSGLIVEERRLAVRTEVGWKQNLTFVFGLPAVSVTRRDAYLQGTATGFQDVLLGLRWNVANGPGALALELDWSAAAGYNRALVSRNQSLGDGLQQLSLAVEGGRAVAGRAFIQGSLGYGYRYLGIGGRSKVPAVPGDGKTPKDFTWADRLLASADAGVWLSRSLLVGGRYGGTKTLSNGPLVPKSDAQLAGALLLYRVDDRLDMFAGSWSTATGKNTLHYDQVYVGVAFHQTKLNRLQGFLGGKQSP